ncbi:MAG: tryptophan--tRNA ligase [Deltaproteobacteria bacterium]|nr:tryptophan--tRNA ligase [Deltaproteobacteria bacterium]
MSASNRLFSGIQPSGALHLGNYFGAVRNWISLQEKYESFICIVDYHTLSGDYSPKDLPKLTLEMALDLLACGVDPEKTVLFVQSHLPEHAELCWILSAYTSYGDLTRMTQFKEKAQRAQFIKAALFNYPVLQAADILLYKASHVPVGEDQIQHLELVRDVTKRFNQAVGKTCFPEVKPIVSKGARIMSLANPETKMSKSLGEKHYIGLMEDLKSIEKKVKSAVTDVGLQEGETMSPGVANLFTLLELCQESLGEEKLRQEIEQLRVEHGSGRLRYSDLKEVLYHALANLLKPIQDRRRHLQVKDAEKVLRQGRERAKSIAEKVIKEVRALVGLLPQK